MPRRSSSRQQPRSHRPHCRRKVTIDPREGGDWSSTIPRTFNQPFYPNSLAMDPMHFVPYIDSASWLYLDPNPVFRIGTPTMRASNSDYAMPPPRRKLQRHHHHHHRHHHPRKHRRVVSDPGTRSWNASNHQAKQHRRVFSFDTGITGIGLLGASIAEAVEETPSPEETATSTFRKVPWHPNLHMLKIRRI